MKLFTYLHISLYISLRGFILLNIFFTETKLNIWVDFSTLKMNFFFW